jgi:hypothetical protein
VGASRSRSTAPVAGHAREEATERGLDPRMRSFPGAP